MEKEICQANLLLAFSQDKQLGNSISLQTYMYTKYMASATPFPSRVHFSFIGCCVEEKHEIQKNSPLDSLQIPRWLLPQSVDSIVPCTIS